MSNKPNKVKVLAEKIQKVLNNRFQGVECHMTYDPKNKSIFLNWENGPDIQYVRPVVSVIAGRQLTYELVRTVKSGKYDINEKYSSKDWFKGV